MNVPSGYTALDMVGFTDKGVYNSATAYVKNDIVHYNGNLWRCLVDDTTDVTPTEGANWTVFLAEPTSAAEDIIAPVESTATSTRIYSVGNQLILGDILYDVTQAINVGDTLTVGTNIAVADTIVEQLAEKANSAALAAVATSGNYSDLNNLPTLGTAAAKNAPASGDASTNEVVMGNDSRLTNARNAADVPAWAKTPNKPTYNGSEIGTSTSKTGTAQQSISDTVASGTSMDDVVGTMLNNDKTLDTNVTSLKETLTNKAIGTENEITQPYYGELGSGTGLTFVENEDGSISINGTLSGTKSYIFRGRTQNTCKLKEGVTYKGILKCDKPSAAGYIKIRMQVDGSSSYLVNANLNTPFEVTSDISLECGFILYMDSSGSSSGIVSFDNATIYPVLVAEEEDTTDLSPIVKTNQGLTKDITGLIDNVNQNGAKNLLPYTLESLKEANTAGSWSDNVYTYNDLTFTVNTNNNSVTDIVVNGTTTQSKTSFYLAKNQSANKYLGKYILNGCPVGGGTSSYFIMTQKRTDDYDQYGVDIGNGSNAFVFSEDAQTLIRIRAITANNLVFKPMLRLASDPDDTFAPYAMTNKQLTDVAEQVQSGYILKSNQNLTDCIVYADGIKTIGELLSELFAAFNTYLSTHPDEWIIPVRVNIANISYFIADTIMGSLVHGSYKNIIPFARVRAGEDYIFISGGTIANTVSGCRYYSFRTDTGQDPEHDKSTVLASGTSIFIHAQIYNKIS